MKYRYTESLAAGDPASPRRVPLVNVLLEGPKDTTVPVLSLLDSGADICIFNSGYAKVLGIDLSECEHAVAVGVGGVPYDIFKTELTLTPQGLPSITVPVMFMDSSGVDGLLGQEGFFDAHHITFRRDQDESEIVPTLHDSLL